MAVRSAPEAEAAFEVGATGDTLERMIRLFARHGDIYRFYVPARKAYTYVIHHPEDIKRVLVSNHHNYTKGFERDRIKILLGSGLMTSEGELWTRQRHMMQPLFHRRMVGEFAAAIAAENETLIERWDAAAMRGELINVTEAMSELTLRIVLRCIFGADTAQVAEPFAVITREPVRNLEFVYKFRALARSVAELVRRRREEQAERFDYIALLMAVRDKQTGAAMSERQLIDEIMTLVVAGHETTASVLNWMWYLVSQHPEVETRLREEIASQREPREPALRDLDALVYAMEVLEEVMRLYPPGWLLSRRTIEPDTLCGCEIPARTDVLLPLYLLHRDRRFWAEPDAFRPERFAPESEAGRPRFAYMPFAAGPRHCIGETLALYEMLMHMQRVVSRFHLTYIDDGPITLDAQINLRTARPLLMRVGRS